MESFVVTVQDMTPLEEQERLRAEFLAMVSHELRTPLAAVKGSITTLLEAAGELEPRRDDAVLSHHPTTSRTRCVSADRRPAGRGPHRDGRPPGGP